MSHSDSTPTGMQLQLYPVIKSIEVVLRNFIIMLFSFFIFVCYGITFGRIHA